MSSRLILMLIIVLLLLVGVSSSLAETSDPAKATSGEVTDLPPEISTRQDDEVLAAESGKREVRTVSLEEAIELALQNNIDLQKARLDYDQAVVDSEQARFNAKEIEVDNLQSAQTKYVSTKQRELAEDVAKQAYEIAKEQTKNLVEKNYYEVSKAENMLRVREAAVTRAQEQCNLVGKKYKAGSAVKPEVHKAEISLASSKADLTNAQRDYKNAQVALNKIIGLEVGTELKVTLALKYEKITLPIVDELTKVALEKRLDMQRARNNEVISQLNYEYVVSFQGGGTFTSRKTKTDLEKAKLEVLQMEQNVKADVLSTIFHVQKAEEVIALSHQSLEQARESQKLAQRRYEIGVGTYVDALTASIDLADAEIKYIDALFNFNQAKNQLNTIILVSR